MAGYAINDEIPQPRGTGPKLTPFCFEDDMREIDFFTPLGEGADAHVFKVMINGTVLALKFPFKDTEIIWPLREGWKIDISETTVRSQYDHFHNECRAFGRLKDVEQEGLAVKCHGYIVLTAEEASSMRLCYLATTGRDWYHPPQPLRCIVKDYIPDSTPFDRGMIKDMMRRLKALNYYGISVSDIHRLQYRSGVLVDFSRARTSPHIELTLNGEWWPVSHVKCAATDDYVRFDDMIDEYNSENPQHPIMDRFLHNPKFTGRLRRAPEESIVKEVTRARLPLAYQIEW
ncbi:hypothetical protein GQ53DRAFT_803998 [Thozetella sp. PMI_491]|nr:hypothetical protein GQ53DRAFT_803998 [Thozetella sp. PMI_491]